MNACTESAAVQVAESVSFDDEPLILVDSANNPIGYDDKSAVHAGPGKLHRAFSIFLFNPLGQVLLQQRSDLKPLWPGFWSNSCCSHPRRGEDLEAATSRRLKEELGVEATLHEIYTFEYRAEFGEAGTEHELCTVYVGQCPDSATIKVHPEEVKHWAWVDCQALDDRMFEKKEPFTPWFQMEWTRLRRDFDRELTERISRYPSSSGS